MGLVKIIKILMIVFNILFLAIGIGFVGAGIWMMVDSTLSQYFGNGNITTLLSATMIAIGAITLIIAFLGCCGAMKESSCMLHTFNVFMIIFILIEATIAGVIWFLAPRLTDYLSDAGKSVIKSTYGIPGGESLTSLYDQMQKDHSCCGFNDGTDYQDAAYLDIPGATSYLHPWPQSCCQADATATECRDTPTPVKSNDQKGCSSVLESLLRRFGDIVAGVMVGLASLQFVAVVFSYCITCSSDKNTVGPY